MEADPSRVVQNLRPRLPVVPGVSGRAEEEREVFCCEGSEEGRGADGRRCGVYAGGEEGSVSGLGEPVPHTPVLHLPDQGDDHRQGSCQSEALPVLTGTNSKTSCKHRKHELEVSKLQKQQEV